jgi:hypothetical protein
VPRVLCTLPHASEQISGVAFERTPAGMLSVEISDEAAARFIRIRGYELAEASAPAPAKAPDPVAVPAPTPAPDGSGDAAAQQTAKPKRRSAN